MIYLLIITLHNSYKDELVNRDLKLKQERESISQATVARDVELETLKSTEVQLRDELIKQRGDVDR